MLPRYPLGVTSRPTVKLLANIRQQRPLKVSPVLENIIRTVPAQVPCFPPRDRPPARRPNMQPPTATAP